MRQSAPKGVNLDLATLVLNLENLHSVKNAADEFMKRELRLDILVNNAGVGSAMCSPIPISIFLPILWD